MSFKKIIGKVHLWLGLASGIVVFIVAVTGCLYAFQREIENMTQPYRFVQPENKPMIAPSILKAAAEKILPGKHIHSVGYRTKDQAAEVTFWNAEPSYYYIVYLNPYTGEVLKTRNAEAGFFQFILEGHYYLWLPHAVGQPIVAYGTLIFVVMLISGLILWWPRNKAARRQRFSVKWNAKWRRVNYDLHNVLGFYMTWVVIFIALTGLVWGFTWFAKATEWAAHAKHSSLYQEPLSDSTAKAQYAQPVDLVWQKLSGENKNSELLEVHFPETATGAIAASTNEDGSTYWKTDYRYFDQYTLKELDAAHIWGRIQEANAGDKLLRMNYDIHTGAVWGLPGKFLAFFASLIAASLPVTGVMIWWGRKKKKPAGKPRKQVMIQEEPVTV